MGNFRIVIDAVGGHGQDRDKKDGEVVDFTKPGSTDYHNENTPEAIAQRAVVELKASGTNVLSAKVYHWLADTVYQGDPVAPLDSNGKECITDDLILGVRKGQF
jgi:hypothetical protein